MKQCPLADIFVKAVKCPALTTFLKDYVAAHKKNLRTEQQVFCKFCIDCIK
jgi:hypothetical protein